jgi:uncharacterized membrane protein SpoIIM required for sporulation
MGALIAAQTVRRRFAYILLSFVVFAGSGVFGFFCLDAFPKTRAQFVPEGFESAFESWKTGTFDSRTLESGAAATAFYMSNNPRASITTGAISASTFGLGTAYMMYQNGAMLGVLVHELVPYGRVGYLFTAITPHGVPEISGLIVSGGAGFLMGHALIAPGRRRRGQALLEAGKDGITLLVVSIILMFIAAPIEGYFSFNGQVADGLKIFVSVVSAAAWGAFWYGFGRDEPDVSIQS